MITCPKCGRALIDTKKTMNCSKCKKSYKVELVGSKLRFMVVKNERATKKIC